MLSFCLSIYPFFFLSFFLLSIFLSIYISPFLSSQSVCYKIYQNVPSIINRMKHAKITCLGIYTIHLILSIYLSLFLSSQFWKNPTTPKLNIIMLQFKVSAIFLSIFLSIFLLSFFLSIYLSLFLSSQFKKKQTFQSK